MKLLAILVVSIWLVGLIAILCMAFIRRRHKRGSAEYLIMRRQQMRRRIVPTPPAGHGFDFGTDLVDDDFARRMTREHPEEFRIVRGK